MTRRREASMRRLYVVVAVSIVLTPVDTLPADGNTVAGKKIYMENCSPCHGEEGKGDGPGARLLPVKPADHTDRKAMSKRSDKDLADIISKGGPAVRKSSYMPAWDGLFNDQQIRDLVAYIRSLARPPLRSSKGIER
jgi:mono/diheme cytochrome c family protein